MVKAETHSPLILKESKMKLGNQIKQDLLTKQISFLNITLCQTLNNGKKKEKIDPSILISTQLKETNITFC